MFRDVVVFQIAEYIKQQVLEFESHLAAATSKQQITESTSLLISQLTRMEPTYVDVLIRICLILNGLLFADVSLTA